nr:hypothetical protein CFP56_46064 [Quercus suber]
MQLIESHTRALENTSISETSKSTNPQKDTTTSVGTQNLTSITLEPHISKSHHIANIHPSRNTESLVGSKIGRWRRLGPPAYAMDSSKTIEQVLGRKCKYEDTEPHIAILTDKNRTYIHLDRVLATMTWKSLFQNTVVQHVPTFASDHSMLIVNLPSIRRRQPKPQHPFRFEAMWLRDPHCAEVVQEAWMEGLYKTEGTPITNCLNSCQACLTSWNKLEFGHVSRQIARLELEVAKRLITTHKNTLTEFRRFVKLLIVSWT